MKPINREDYPELDTILWDIHTKKIAPDTAFNMYERRWGFVDQNNLTAQEKQLIDNLANQYGNGCFMPATP